MGQSQSEEVNQSASGSATQHQRGPQPPASIPAEQAYVMVDEAAKEKANKLREEGNICFKKQKYSAAIEYYTEAICHAPSWEIPYLNRALCYKKREQWGRCREDCQRALALNSGLHKAYYMLGYSEMELRDNNMDLQGAIDHLTKALELARELNDGIKDEIWRVLARAKYTQWQEQSSQRKRRQQHLQETLQRLLDQENAAVEAQGPEAAEALQQDIGTLQHILLRCRKDDEPGEIPAAYVCRLTMDIFRDPVMTPAGLSYERSALTEHLNKVGKFDPVTRTPMSASQMVTNMGLRSATQQFLDDHPWAWEECM